MNPNFTKFTYREFLERNLLLSKFNLKLILELYEIMNSCKNFKEFTSNIRVIQYVKICQEAAEVNFSVPGFIDYQAMNWVGCISYFFNNLAISDELNATRWLTFRNYFNKWIKIVEKEIESMSNMLLIPGKLIPPKFIGKEISSLGVVPAVDFNETYQLDVSETFVGGFRAFTKHFCEHIENCVIEKKTKVFDQTCNEIDSLINYEKQSDILRFVRLFTEYYRLKKRFEISRSSRLPSEVSTIFAMKNSLTQFLENLLEKYSWLLKSLQISILDLIEFSKINICDKFNLVGYNELQNFKIFEYIENDNVLIERVFKLSKNDKSFFIKIPRELLLVCVAYELPIDDKLSSILSYADFSELAIQINLIFTQMQTLCNFVSELLYCSKLLEKDDLFFSINPFTGFYSLTKLGIPVNSLLPQEALVFSLEINKPKDSIFFICEDDPEVTDVYSRSLDIIDEVVEDEHKEVFKKYFDRTESKPNIRKDVAKLVTDFSAEGINAPKKILIKKSKKLK